MTRHLPLLTLIALTSAACTQAQVEVVDKGSLFYGQHQTVEVAGFVPGQQEPEIAEKYKETEYVQPTPALSVEVADLPAPVTVEALEPIEAVELVQAEPVAEVASIAPLKMSKTALQATSNSTFSWPVEGPVLSHYGPKSGGLVNDGINIAAASGEPIWAAAGGEIAYSGNNIADYGNMVIVRHANGWMSAYGHASDLLVKKGDVIKQGDLLGYVGQSGNVDQPQLHFGLRKNDQPVDPLGLLPQRLASAQ